MFPAIFIKYSAQRSLTATRCHSIQATQPASICARFRQNILFWWLSDLQYLPPVFVPTCKLAAKERARIFHSFARHWWYGESHSFLGKCGKLVAWASAICQDCSNYFSETSHWKLQRADAPQIGTFFTLLPWNTSLRLVLQRILLCLWQHLPFPLSTDTYVLNVWTLYSTSV